MSKETEKERQKGENYFKKELYQFLINPQYILKISAVGSFFFTQSNFWRSKPA